MVTGVARHLGAQVAARLAADPRIERVIGVDGAVPSGETARVLADVDVRQCDLRSPQIALMLADSGADVSRPGSSPGAGSRRSCTWTSPPAPVPSPVAGRR